MQLTPYLMFNGNCEEALNFYAKALGGEIKSLMRYEGSPVESMAAAGEKQRIMHSNFVADGITFMAADTGEGGPGLNKNGMVYLSIHFNDGAKQEKVFNALAEAGKIGMQLQDTFWGARFGMLTDKFGINWMLNFEKPKQK